MARSLRLKWHSGQRPMHTSPQLVSIISVYNCSRWLRGRIDNLMATDLYKRGGLLIYAVNASSPDPEDDRICASFAGAANFHYETIPWCTVYGAWTHCIKNTTQPYITNANADDVCSPECYDILIDACEKHGAILAHCDWYTIGDKVKSWQDISGTAGNGSPYNPTVDQMSAGHAPLWRRSLHDKIGYHDPWFHALGDADLLWRAWISGVANFSYVGLPMVGYRWRGESGNLWHCTSDARRADEWARLRSRQPGKLEV